MNGIYLVPGVILMLMWIVLVLIQLQQLYFFIYDFLFYFQLPIYLCDIYLLMMTTSVNWVFCSLFILLLIFMPSFYSISTSFFFFMFTIFGTISFIISLLIMISSFSLLCLMTMVPFCIKIPTFPFLYWLPEVHCECNTSISLFLAGLLLKSSLYGMVSFILIEWFFSLRYFTSIIISFCIISIIISSYICFIYFDSKKIMTFSSMLHLNISLVSIFSLNCCGLLSAIIISMSHGSSSISMFMWAGLIINKTYSSYMDSGYFINNMLRSLLLFILLANLSFPITTNFVAEILSLVAIISISSFVCLMMLLTNYMSTLFWIMMLNSKMNNHYCFALITMQLYSLFWLCITNLNWFMYSITMMHPTTSQYMLCLFYLLLTLLYLFWC